MIDIYHVSDLSFTAFLLSVLTAATWQEDQLMELYISGTSWQGKWTGLWTETTSKNRTDVGTDNSYISNTHKCWY